MEARNNPISTHSSLSDAINCAEYILHQEINSVVQYFSNGEVSFTQYYKSGCIAERLFQAHVAGFEMIGFFDEQGVCEHITFFLDSRHDLQQIIEYLNKNYGYDYVLQSWVLPFAYLKLDFEKEKRGFSFFPVPLNLFQVDL